MDADTTITQQSKTALIAAKDSQANVFVDGTDVLWLLIDHMMNNST